MPTCPAILPDDTEVEVEFTLRLYGEMLFGDGAHYDTSPAVSLDALDGVFEVPCGDRSHRRCVDLLPLLSEPARARVVQQVGEWVEEHQERLVQEEQEAMRWEEADRRIQEIKEEGC